MSAVVPFRRPAAKRPAPPDRPIAPTGSEVFVCETDSGWFHVYDLSPSGGSAGGHGYFETHAEAVAVAKQIAATIGGTFIDVTDDGGKP